MQQNLIVEKYKRKNLSYEINYLIYYFDSILAIIFTIFKEISIILIQFLILIKSLIFILKNLMISPKIRDI